MILFIHGFASCGLGHKSQLLIDYFGRDQVLTPDLPFRPVEAIAALEALLAEHPVDLLAGASLGGFYATWLNRERCIPSVLINPVVRPHVLLSDHLGTQTRWCDGQTFEFTRADAEPLKAMYRPTRKPDERYLVLLQRGDEILDYRQAADYYRDQQVIIEAGGNHRFENLADYLPHITAFRHDPDRTT